MDTLIAVLFCLALIGCGAGIAMGMEDLLDELTAKFRRRRK